MRFPDVIVSEYDENPHGIIYEIKQRTKNDNILNFVEVSSNSKYTDRLTDTIIAWNSSWQSNSAENIYLQIEFKNKFVFGS